MDKHKIDWRKILKTNGTEIYKDIAQEEEPHYRLDFNPFPSSAIQRKMDYYYLPYNYN